MSVWDPEDRIDRLPTRTSGALALVAGVVATMASAGPPLAALVCVVGVVVLAAGLVTGRQSAVTAGAGLLVLGALLGGTRSLPVLSTLVGVAAGLLAFDLGSTAVALGDQLGREADTLQVELLHAAASTLVGATFVTVGFTVHEVASGGRPLSGVLALLVAAVVLVAALRRVDPVR